MEIYMPYVDGFVIAVPTANKEAFISYAQEVDHLFIKHGALQILECSRICLLMESVSYMAGLKLS